MCECHFRPVFACFSSRRRRRLTPPAHLEAGPRNAVIRANSKRPTALFGAGHWQSVVPPAIWGRALAYVRRVCHRLRPAWPNGGSEVGATAARARGGRRSLALVSRRSSHIKARPVCTFDHLQALLSCTPFLLSCSSCLSPANQTPRLRSKSAQHSTTQKSRSSHRFSPQQWAC